MAAEIDNYLRTHRKEIVDLIQEKGTAENIRGEAFENVVNHLMTVLPLGKDNQSCRDKAHEELAIAIIHSMWCGWLSQAKAADGRYTQDHVVWFRNAITSAFVIGQEYAPERP